ncbi:hypothetical protein [Dactylosporangium sp. CA-233914]|uniref:hypothetical protein n=1 Tax=Dactylosporangium sp. CA-233914 TaxID=3239934 RepID=UPI003D8C312F
MEVHGSGAATAVGGVAISGVNTAPITVHPPAVPRSDYLEQVRRIAPSDLREREPELAGLAAFCFADAAYAWWRGEAWAGKSALLSWFVLHPPEGVRVVSFFVTARFAGQSDRVAFAEVLLEQLAELLGEPLPPLLTESTRDAHLLGMLSRASAHCGRLVLVVDGLDEDRGAHSIAALLPARPPQGLRVVVAGRPNPPIPPDVPDEHPLRDPAIVRELSPSPFADVVRADAHRDLKRLLHGDPLERAVLGLLTASGGGLREADLTELTGAESWRVAEALAARTFSPRSGPAGYVLAHEELARQATRYLEASLPDLHRRLHAWAGAYRARGWPPGTPDYLLYGYFHRLRSLGDTGRMLSCATDRPRHDRMLEHSGGDIAALTEVDATLSLLLAAAGPDLRAMARLAVERTRLLHRNEHLPPGLPAVWELIGNRPRALALARAAQMGEHGTHHQLVMVAERIAGRGEYDAAAELVTQLRPIRRPFALCRVAHVAVRRGDLTAAAELVAAASAAAEALAGDTWLRTEARKWVEQATEAVRAGPRPARRRPGGGSHPATDLDDAVAAVTELAATAFDEETRLYLEYALADVVRSLVAAGDPARAVTVAGLTPPHGRSLESVRLTLIDTLMQHGHVEQAEAYAGMLPPRHAAQARTAIAFHLADAGDFERAATIAHEAERTGRDPAGGDHPAEPVAALALALLDAGRCEDATPLVGRILGALHRGAAGHDHERILIRLAGALHESGARAESDAIGNFLDPDPNSLIRRVITAPVPAPRSGRPPREPFTGDLEAAQRLELPEERSLALYDVAAALLEAGRTDQALDVARLIPIDSARARALLKLGERLPGPMRRRLIGESLTFARWEIALHHLAEEEPQALTVLLEELR